MGRIVLIITLFVMLPLSAYVQVADSTALKSDHAFFSLAYYHLFDKNIPHSLLQQYVNALNSVGDKELLKQATIQSWMQEATEDNSSAAASPITALNTEQLDLPFNFSFAPNNLFNLVKFMLFNELLKEDAESEEVFQYLENIVMKYFTFSPKIASVMLKEENEEDGNCENLYRDIYANAVSAPQEVKMLSDYFEGAYSNYVHNCEPVDRENYYFKVETQAINQFPAIMYILDCHRLENVVYTKDELSFYKTTAVNEIFNKLLLRQPSPEEKEFYENILSNGAKENLKIVYYLIMTSDEYNYY